MAIATTFQRLFHALSFANAGEALTLKQKSAVLRGMPGNDAQASLAPVASNAPATSCTTPRSQVGLYLGSELPASVMQYVVQTCSRLHHGLTVFSFQSEREIDALLAPYHASLMDANIAMRVVALTGDPAKVLGNTLKRRSDIAFLVCNESGFIGNRLTRGAMSPDSLSIPVVLVAARGTAVGVDAAPAHVRAA